MTETANSVQKAARLCGRLMLESGAEIYRVEETVSLILSAFDLQGVSVLALPTGVFYSFTEEDGKTVGEVIRTKVRTTDLGRVSRVNAISRKLVKGETSVEEALVLLEQEQSRPPRPLYMEMLASAVTASSFAVLFGGNAWDFLVAFLCGVAESALGLLFPRDNVSKAVYLMLSGVLCALMAMLATSFSPVFSRTPIIVGAIMPLLPGLAITNAIRDTVTGDLVSGVARVADALLQAVAIAAGVAVVIALWH